MGDVQLAEVNGSVNWGIESPKLHVVRSYLAREEIDLGDPDSIAGRQAVLLNEVTKIAGGVKLAVATLAHIRNPEEQATELSAEYSLNAVFVLSALQKSGALKDQADLNNLAELTGYSSNHTMRSYLASVNRRKLVDFGHKKGYPINLSEMGHRYVDYYSWLLPADYDAKKATADREIFAPSLYKLVDFLDEATDTEATDPRSRRWLTNNGDPISLRIAEDLNDSDVRTSRLLNQSVNQRLAEVKTDRSGRTLMNIAVALRELGKDWLETSRQKFPLQIARLYYEDENGNIILESLDKDELHKRIKSMSEELETMHSTLSLPQEDYTDGIGKLDETELRLKLAELTTTMQSLEQQIDRKTWVSSSR